MARADDTLAACDKAIELKPDLAVGWFNRACVRCNLGQSKGTILDDLRRAIEFDPSCRATAREDDDFAPLHDDPDFITLTREPEERGDSGTT